MGAAERLAHWSIRHRWKALLLWLLLVAVAVVGGGAAGTRLLTDGEVGAGESGRADRQLEQAGYPADITERVLVQARSGEQLTPAAAREVADDLRERLGDLPEVDRVGRLVRSDDGRSAVLPVVLDVDGATGTAAEDVADTRIEAVQAATAAVARAHPDLRVAGVGDASINHAINATVADDFQRAETFSLPVTLGILLLTFGALFAAGIPVLLALSAVATAIGFAALVSHLFPVSDTLSSVILLIGMAVGVDYSLFYVRRSREERAKGADRRQAIDIAAATSGRAVVVSGIAVVVAMAGLLLAGNAVFSSMAVGTMLVVAVAVLGSLTVLPAVLSLLGDKVDRPRIPLVHRLRRPGGGRFWPTVMRAVLARPMVSMVARRRGAARAGGAGARHAAGGVRGRLAAAVHPRAAHLRRHDGGLPRDRLRAHRRGVVRRRPAAGRARRPRRPGRPGRRRRPDRPVHRRRGGDGRRRAGRAHRHARPADGGRLQQRAGAAGAGHAAHRPGAAAGGPAARRRGRGDR